MAMGLSQSHGRAFPSLKLYGSKASMREKKGKGI
jgi:hypothetical protein